MTQQINLGTQAILPVGETLTLDGNVTFNGTVTGVGGSVTIVTTQSQVLTSGGTYLLEIPVTQPLITLPDATLVTGQVVTIKNLVNSPGYSAIVYTQNSQTIDGNPPQNYNLFYAQTISYISDGSNWWTIGQSVFTGPLEVLGSFNCDDFGITTDGAGNMTVGTSVITPSIQITNAPVAGYVLTSDASGIGTWQAGGGGGAPVVQKNVITSNGQIFTISAPGFYYYDGSANNAYCIVQLPDATTFTPGLPILVAATGNSSNQQVQFQLFNDSQTIDGIPSGPSNIGNYSLSPANSNNVSSGPIAYFISDGANWVIVANENFQSSSISANIGMLLSTLTITGGDIQNTSGGLYAPSGTVTANTFTFNSNIQSSSGFSIDVNGNINASNGTATLNSLNVGSNNFTVDSSGNLLTDGTNFQVTNAGQVRSVSFSLISGNFQTDVNGNTLVGGTFSAGAGNFFIDGSSNAHNYGTLSIGSSLQFKIDASGNVSLNNTALTLNIDGSASFGTGALTIDTSGDLTTTGLIVTPSIQITSSPSAGFVLTSDASGNGTWQAPGSVTPANYFTTTTETSNSSTSYTVTSVSTTFALSNVSHRVKITVRGNLLVETNGTIGNLTILMDGTTDLAPTTDGLVQYANDTSSDDNTPICFFAVYGPGDTSSHTYAVYSKTGDGSAIDFPSGFSASMLIEEIQ